MTGRSFVTVNGREVQWFFRTEEEADRFACEVVAKSEESQIATVSRTSTGAWMVQLRPDFDA